MLFTADLDRGRLDEWIAANFDGEEVEIVDRTTGDILETSEASVDWPFICPKCGEGAVGIRLGSVKRYVHAGGETCEVKS